ncbi:MAG: ATP-binding protein [Clostridiales bacterium]|nr:ATP-binding protein [Clostridiales bacterium]
MSLTNTQYDEIMRSYQDRQMKRRRLIADRKKEAADRSPQLAGLDAEVARCSVSRVTRLLNGETGALAGASDEIAALSARREELLVSLGYPADYFEPPYDCPDCQDTGYIGNRRCHCFLQASIDLVYAQSNLSSILEEENFSHFSLRYYADDLYAPGSTVSSRAAAQNACSKCRRFAEEFDTEYQNILLFGDTGVGKTFLSHCVAKELLDTGHSVIYFSAQQLFDRLAEHAFRRDTAAASDYNNIFDCDLLIIDDLGTEMANTFTSSQFFVCLNERILHRRSTIISTNLGLQDIASIYSERIFSRITSDFLLLHLFGKDIRIQKTF